MLHYNTLKPIAIIPARGGSKSIPKKNIKPLNGKPLIFYTIKSAQDASLFERIIVSTDNDEIAEIAQQYGAEVIKRPEELAKDTSPTEDALIHVLDVLKEKENYQPTIVLTLEPTSPLRSAATIKGIVDLYKATDADSVISLEQEHECHGYLKDGRLEFLIKNPPRRRQGRQPIYKENGGTYLTETSVLREKRKVLGDNLFGYVLPREEALDINDVLDFQIAEAIMKKYD